MYPKKKMQRFSAAFLVFFCASAGAVEIDVELEVGVGHTDNITRTEDTVAEPAMDDTVYEAGLAVTLEHESARADVDLRGSLFFHDYQEAVRFRGRAHNYKNTLRDFDRNFAIRTVDGGWRVWRVS